MRTKGKERPSAWDKDELRALEHEKVECVHRISSLTIDR